MRVPIGKFSLCLLFMLTDCFAQDWSPPQPVTGLPSVTFSFRNTGTGEIPDTRAVEWIFRNNADTALTFVYRLVTDKNDTLTGYQTIGGRKGEYSGWLIRGENFIIVEWKNVPVP